VTAGTAATATRADADRSRRERFWFPPIALGRIAALRAVAYVFVLLDIGWWTPWARAHRDIPAFYQPLAIGRVLHLPVPTPRVVDVVELLLVLVTVTALLVAVTAIRRVHARVVHGLSAAVALLYGEWMVIAMSYGKVDHDHLAIVIAVFVLPTVAGARWSSTERSEAAGWALRWIEIGVVATYFLAAYAKVRFGGWHWVNGATFAWAVVRRGTALADPLLHHPTVLLLAQWGLFAFEVLTPLMLFVRQRWRTCAVVFLLGFHVMTWLTITINFAPLMCCLAVFLPLERLAAAATRWRATARGLSPGRRPAPQG
jgi:hypothetical protein